MTYEREIPAVRILASTLQRFVPEGPDLTEAQKALDDLRSEIAELQAWAANSQEQPK